MSVLSTPKPPKGYEMLQFPTRGGQGANIYSQLASGISGGLPDVLQQLIGQAQGKGNAFAPQEQQAMNLFQQQVAPQIAQRYAGSGIGASSGMQNALAGAAGNLTADLSAQRQNLMHQSMRDVLNLGNLLLQSPDQENYFMKKPKTDWLGNILGIGLPVVGGIAGGIFGGPMGAAAGISAGSTLASGFTGRDSKPDWSGIGSLPTSWKSGTGVSPTKGGG